MKNIQYFEILKDALLITWKNKFLWVFGFLIFLGSAGSNFSGKNDSANDPGAKVQDVAVFIQNNPKIFIALVVVFLIVMLFLFLLRILATAGIIRSVNDLNLYRQMPIVAILKESRKYLWKLLLLEIVVAATLIVIMVVLAVPVTYLFSLNAKIFASFILVGAVVIVVPLVVLAYYLIRYAGYYIVLANEKVKTSLEMAYVMFMKNVKESLLMGVVNIVVSIVMIVLAILTVLLFAIPFVLLGFAAYLIFAKTGAIVILIIAGVLCGLLLAALFSWYMAFLQTAWLLFFQQISFEKDKEKKILDKLEAEEEIPNPEVA